MGGPVLYFCTVLRSIDIVRMCMYFVKCPRLSAECDFNVAHARSLFYSYVSLSQACLPCTLKPTWCDMFNLPQAFGLRIHICKLFLGGCRSVVALSAAGHAAGTPVHHDARLDPGRSPWRVLWASKVARAGSFTRECAPPR